MKNYINSIKGEYQYEALNNGNPAQRQWHKNRHNLIKYLEFFKEDDTVLDAGCGSGNLVLEYAPSVTSIVGIDNNKKCIDFLNAKIREKRLKNASVHHKNLLKKINLDKKFSKIILSEVIEHFSEKDVRIVLKNIKNVLEDDGEIIVTTPNYQSAWPILEKLIDFFSLSPKLWGEQHLIKFTPQKLKKIIEESGFRVERIGTLNFFSPFLATINYNLSDKLSYIEFRLPLFGNLIYATFKKIDKQKIT